MIAPDSTTGGPWSHWPRGWVAYTAGVLAIVVVVLLAWLR
jgi:hypothetical protein